MKINQKQFCLPPYISTTWNNICGLHMKGGILVVTMPYGETINIPGLKPELIETIFTAHASYLEQENQQSQSLKGPQFANPNTNPYIGKNSFTQQLFGADPSSEFPFRLGFGHVEGFGSALTHNPAQANAPDLPKEIIQKISAIAKIVAPDDSHSLPKAEPHCNCAHCQIARAINQGAEPKAQEESEEETVSDAELNFQQWDITQTGEKLFTVVNRLDSNEKYSVYLGHPVGCTCGKTGCEHILAVLKS